MPWWSVVIVIELADDVDVLWTIFCDLSNTTAFTLEEVVHCIICFA